MTPPSTCEQLGLELQLRELLGRAGLETKGMGSETPQARSARSLVEAES
jgi:hypothetical protein